MTQSARALELELARMKSEMEEMKAIIGAKDAELTTQKEAHTIAIKKATHDALMHANEGIPLVYIAELNVILPDGRFLVKYGETDNVVSREPQLRKLYGPIYFTKHYVCTQPHKYEQWLKRDKLFIKHKYSGTINGRRYEELLAVTQAEYKMIQRLMNRNIGMFNGLTAEQTLEKTRLETVVEIAKMTDPAVQMAMVDAFRTLLSTRSSHAPVQLSDHVSSQLISRSVSDNASDNDSDIIDMLPSDDVGQQPDIVRIADPYVVIPVGSSEHRLLPPQPKKKLGRPVKPKVPPPTDANTPLQCFLDECFDVGDPEGRTHVAIVRARHRLWRHSHVSRAETGVMIDFFKQRYNVVVEMDEGHDMRSSFYKGITMRPWVPKCVPATSASDSDIDAFVQDTCEPHVMGRVKTSDLWDAFVAWKQGDYSASPSERDRFISHMKRSFVYHTGVPTTKAGTGAAGFYGLYLSTATAECREVGYNRSPNTRGVVLKLDAGGSVVGVIDSQDAFAHGVAKKSSQHMCVMFTKCFENGMKGVEIGDGYTYMRAKDHEKMSVRSNVTSV